MQWFRRQRRWKLEYVGLMVFCLDLLREDGTVRLVFDPQVAVLDTQHLMHFEARAASRVVCQKNTRLISSREGAIGDGAQSRKRAHDTDLLATHQSTFHPTMGQAINQPTGRPTERI